VREDEDLLLELLNTTPVSGTVEVDELADDEVASAWLAERGSRTAPSAARAVRAAIQDVVRGVSGPSALEPFLNDVRSIPVVDGGGVRWETAIPPEAAFASRMVLTWGDLQSRRPGRLRPCANPECRRFLIDRSRANTAQWCSMALCGNRMKARRHYERSRGSSAEGIAL